MFRNIDTLPREQFPLHGVLVTDCDLHVQRKTCRHNHNVVCQNEILSFHIRDSYDKHVQMMNNINVKRNKSHITMKK